LRASSAEAQLAAARVDANGWQKRAQQASQIVAALQVLLLLLLIYKCVFIVMRM
jgi:hypothetical protein